MPERVTHPDVHPPVSKFVQSCLDDNYYTPDAPHIYQKQWQPLFVYGTLKQGYSRDSLLSGSIRVGYGYTMSTSWVMYRTKNKSPFPVVLQAEDGTPPGGICGEVYLVRPKIISNLDFIESNGIMYHRTLRTILLPVANSQQPDHRLTCHVYLGIPAHWKHNLQRGDLTVCDRLTRNKNKNYHYYTFMRKYIVKVPSTLSNL
jgi:gamma-glutamylcyclotransferase (GGCT)/AIG2-like uncharacterized protein YtfP